MLSILSPHMEISATLYLFKELYSLAVSLFYLYFYYYYFFFPPHFSFLLRFSTLVTHFTIQNPATTTTPPLHQVTNSKPNIQNQPKSKPKPKSTTPVTHSVTQIST